MKLTKEQEEWLTSNYPNIKNKVLADHFGVSESTIRVTARGLGLVKSDDFLKACKKENAHKMTLANKARGYPPKGYVIPNSQGNAFKKGVSLIERHGEEVEAKRREKSQDALRKLRSLEKGRALFGLPRQTKLNVVKRPKSQSWMRYYLRRRCGYIMDDTGFVFYYDENTKRSEKIENRPRTGFTFLPKEK